MPSIFATCYLSLFIRQLLHLVLLEKTCVRGQTCGNGGDQGTCIASSRSSKNSKSVEVRHGLRFGIGDAVMVQMGRKEWKVGRVHAVNYREPSWPSNQVAPYMVALEEGGMVYAPEDDPRLIR